MQNLERILGTASERQAFPSHGSWAMWSRRWCDYCVHDTWGACPLLMAVFRGHTPIEWVEVGPQNYECTEFEPREEEQL